MVCSCKVVVSTGIALAGGALQITIPSMTFVNGECMGLYLAQSIPNDGTAVPVQILMDGTAYPLEKPCGNYVMSDQLRTQRSYCLRCGTNPGHFTVRRAYALCRTSFVPPQLNPETPAATTQSSGN